MDIHWIHREVKAGRFEISMHAEEERQDDEITVSDLEFALLNGEILEHYPDDPRGDSCLVIGYAKSGYPIHIVLRRTQTNYLRVITVYIPTFPKWIDPKTRRRT